MKPPRPPKRLITFNLSHADYERWKREQAAKPVKH